MQNVIDKIEWMFAGLGGFLGWFFGGFDGFLYALVVFVVCDYFTGVLAAAIKHELSSEVGFKGIAKKVCIFVLVGIANIIDTQILQNGAAIRTAVVFFYLANEGLSCLENAAVIGLPVPEKLKEMLAQLKEEKENKDESAVDENEFPTAEELPATIAYGKLKTLMNIRKKPSLEAEVVAVYKKNALVEVVQFCDGWLKIKCAEAEDGVAYVLNSADTYAFTAGRIYTVVPGDIISGRSQIRNWEAAAAVQISVC